MKYYEQYRILHNTKKYGISGDHAADKIVPVIPEGTKSLLDYGAGQSNLAALLSRKAGIADVCAYDPCVRGRDKKPERSFDFVTCTDVLEHVPEEELDDLLTEVWGYQEKGAVFQIALREAAHVLPNGENCHCTVHPADWWERKLKSVFNEVIEIPSLSITHSVACFLVRSSS